MSDEARIIAVCLGPLFLIAGVMIWALVHRDRAAARERDKDAQRRHYHAARITDLLEQLPTRPHSIDAQRVLLQLMRGPAIGYFPELTAPGGWFERTAPILVDLAQSSSGRALVEAYFQVFTFPAGQQAQVLRFVHLIMQTENAFPELLPFLERLTSPVVATSSAAEAQWLYDRSLELVRDKAGNPAAKALALRIGRGTYAKLRLDGRTTADDEQAIANDIAARIP